MSAKHRLASYVPRLIRQRLADGGFSEEPCRQIEQSVLLLGDIVGSTRIVEQVTQRGSLAVESLTENLNDVFARFVDHIYDAGGDVLFIAGDAFLCYWPANNYPSLDEPVRQATSAALRIQRDMQDHDDGFGNPVQFRVGVAAGELSRVFVGGFGNRWEPILTGEVFEQVVLAEHLASAGSVRLSARACQAISTDLTGRGERHDDGAELDWRTTDPEQIASVNASVSQENAEPDAHLLEPYLPSPVVGRKLIASNTWLHEVRLVTVLMADLSAIKLQSGEDIDRLHQAVGTFQKIVDHYEGSLRVDADDKGAMLFSVFGLPPNAHEDDAVRAIHAAWELQSSLHSLGVTPGIGIASGRALCAPLGNERRREFMVRGNVTNRAARLMQATNDQIACDENTVTASRMSIEFESLPNHLVKGLSDALDVRRPMGVRESVNRNSSEIIGRESYLERMLQLLDRTHKEQVSQTVLLRGEPGLGKSSLIDSVALRAANAGIRVLRAGADAIERTSSLYAWRRTFADMFGLTPKTDAATRRDRVTMQMERYPDLLPLTPLLAAVVGVEFEPTEATRYLEGETRAAKTIDVLVQLLTHFVHGAQSLLIVEDAHWLDSRSAQLLQQVCQSLPASSIAVTSRPVNETNVDWNHIGNCDVLDLKPFDEHEVRELVARRIGVASVPEELTALIHQRSGGNPFFAEQIIHAMIDDDVLGAQYGEYRFDSAKEFSIPSNVEGMVLGRLDKLPEQQALLLKTASIAGREFSTESVLSAVQVPIDRSHAQADFAGLESAGFLDATDQPDQLRFRHVITREVTYASMTHAQQVQGHKAFAGWLEEHQRSGWVNYPLMAYHWRAAGNHERALELLEKAGERALFSGGYQEALSFYNEAKELGRGINIASESLRAVRWEKGLGSAHYFLGDMDESRTHLEKVVATLDRPVPTNKGAAMPSTLGGAFSQWWHRKRNETAAGRCDEQDKPKYDMLIDTYKTLGQLYYLEGEPAELLVYLNMRGLNIGELAGPSSAFACVLTNMSVTASMVRLDGAANWYSKRAYAMAELEAHRGAAAYVAHIAALRHAQHGDWEAALAANDEAHQLMDDLGDHTLATEAAAIRSAVLLCAGDIKAAIPVVTHAREVAEKSKNEQFLCWALLDGVETALADNDIDQANRWLEKAMAIETAPADLSSSLDKHRATAILRLREHKLDQARQAASTVTEIIAAHPPTSYYFLDFYAAAIEVLIQIYQENQGDKALEKRITESLKSLKKLSATFWNVKPRYWLLHGQFLACGDNDAGKSLKQALTLAQDLKMPFELARALGALAENGFGTQEGLQEATRTYKRLGQNFLAEKLQVVPRTE